MTNSERDPPTNQQRHSDPHSVIEYALEVTDTVIWDWSIPEDDLSLYPPSQKVFSEISGSNEFFAQVHPSDRQMVAEALEVALEQNGSYYTEFRLAKEKERWITAQGQVEYDEKGQPQHLTGVGQDVTERKQQSRQLRRFGEHIAETELISEMGGWELDLNTNEIWWTSGTKRIHQVSSDYEPTLEEALEFYHPDDRPIIEQAVQLCQEYGEPFNVEIRLITTKGDERWVHCRGEKVQHGGVEILRGVIRDITERKIRDQRLMVLNRVLRHNIRNSLSVVIGNAEFLHEELESLAPIAENLSETASFSLEDARHFLSKIDTNAKQLVEMAENARRLSRVLERGPARYHVEVTPIVSRLVSKFTERYPDATIRVEKTEVGVRGNPDSLEMALNELLKNAIIHNQQPSPTVKIRVSKLEKERVGIQVVDTGPGIPEIEQEVLQKGAEEPLIHGRGTGLWMVNWLMVQLSGSISIDDNDPKGSIVTLKLPASVTE